jgi:hypothetical protein
VQYEDAISIFKEDLLDIEKHKQEFTPISELKTINTLSITLESKLQGFKQILPKPDSRRALLGFGGTVLKTLFGTAVISYVNLLHEMFDELKLNQRDMVHSLGNQLYYI